MTSETSEPRPANSPFTADEVARFGRRMRLATFGLMVGGAVLMAIRHVTDRPHHTARIFLAVFGDHPLGMDPYWFELLVMELLLAPLLVASWSFGPVLAHAVTSDRQDRLDVLSVWWKRGLPAPVRRARLLAIGWTLLFLLLTLGWIFWTANV